MSSFLELMTGITLATIAVHFLTGQGKITAIILIVDAVLTLAALIERIGKKAKKHGRS